MSSTFKKAIMINTKDTDAFCDSIHLDANTVIEQYEAPTL
jgi:hypothetical protein